MADGGGGDVVHGDDVVNGDDVVVVVDGGDDVVGGDLTGVGAGLRPKRRRVRRGSADGMFDCAVLVLGVWRRKRGRRRPRGCGWSGAAAVVISGITVSDAENWGKIQKKRKQGNKIGIGSQRRVVRGDGGGEEER